LVINFVPNYIMNIYNLKFENKGGINVL